MPVSPGRVGWLGMFAPGAEAQAARAAASVGIPFVESTVSICSVEEVAAAAPGPPWFQLYVMRDRGYAEELMARAAAVGAPVLVLTIDLAVVGARHRDTRNAVVGAGTPWVRAHWDGKLIVKGVLDAADARRAVDAGVDGIVVSNHGGRQLDSVPSTVRALPAIVDAVAGEAEVLADGGVRNGLDVVKMLSLGARAVLLGRAWAWALSEQAP